MAKQRLTSIWVEEVSLCEKGKNEGAKVALFKALDDDSIVDDEGEEMASKKKSATPKSLDLEQIPEELRDQVKEIVGKAERIDELEADATKHADALKERDDKLTGLTKQVEELSKSKDDDGVPEPVKKTLGEQAERIEKQDKLLEKQGTVIDEMKKKDKRRELLEKVNAMPHLTEDRDELIDELEKADAAGILDTVLKTLERANTTAAKAAVLFKEIGAVGAGPDSTGDAWDEVQRLSKEMISKSDKELSPASAMEKVFQENPDLEKRYAQEVRN